MKKMLKKTIAFLMVAVITLIFVPTGFCASKMVEYSIAETGVKVSMPDEWFYSDRSIKDDDPFCVGLKVTAEEFKEQHLYNDTFMFAYDVDTKTFMTLDVEKANTSDYSGMNDTEIKAAGAKEYDWWESEGNKFLSKSVVKHNGISYYKLISEQSNGLTRYYYDTVQNGKRYVFTFLLTSEDNNSTIEKLYDSIIDTAVLPGIAGNQKGASTLMTQQTSDEEGVESFRFDDCFMFMRKNYVYTKRGDKDMDYSAQYMFDNDEHLQAEVHYDGMLAFVVSYPRKHKTALSDNECLLEIISYAKGGFGYVSKSFTVYALGNHCYFFAQKDDKMGTNVEYMTAYFFHKNGIVAISLNDTFESDSQRDKSIDFLLDLVDSIWPLETMPEDSIV